MISNNRERRKKVLYHSDANDAHMIILFLVNILILSPDMSTIVEMSTTEVGFVIRDEHRGLLDKQRVNKGLERIVYDVQ